MPLEHRLDAYPPGFLTNQELPEIGRRMACAGQYAVAACIQAERNAGGESSLQAAFEPPVEAGKHLGGRRNGFGKRADRKTMRSSRLKEAGRVPII